MLKTILSRPVTITMIFIAVAVFGVISYNKLPVNLLPNIKYPSLTIWTEYSGNSPEEVENEITSLLEASIGAVKGIKKISSTSRDGISLITVDFEWGTDMDFAVLSLREKLDSANLPDGSERPNIIRIDPSEKPIMGISVIGENLFSVRNTCEQIIKRRLEQLEGVALADVVGGEEKEIKVNINLKKANRLGITFADIGNAINSANVEQRSGNIRDDVYLYELKISSQYESLQDIENTLVKQLSNGKNIFIKDLAEVELTDKERTAFTRFNQRPSVGLLIRKDADANAVTVSELVNKELDLIIKDHPKLTITKAFDQADFIQESIDNVKSAVLIGGVLAFITLFFFLRDWRAPSNIALSIPISILATFALLYFNNISINLMSLSGLALGVGMLVDNSIVILENIMRHKQMGKSLADACFEGTKEVAMPVSASTLTTIIVFMPIVFVSGVAGELFKDQSIAVTFSLLSSLIVSLTLLPVIASKMELKFTSREKIDRSLESEPGRFYKIGTYWFSLFLVSYVVYMFKNLPEIIDFHFRNFLSFFMEIKVPEDVSTFEDVSSVIYMLFLMLILDLVFKQLENFLRLRRLKKENPESYKTQGKNLRFFLINLLVLLPIMTFVLPAVYGCRVDLFEPVYRFFSILEVGFIDEYLIPVLYDISNFVKEFFQPYEEELGTDTFVTIVYIIGGVFFLIYLTGLASFNFLRKIPKEANLANAQVLEVRGIIKKSIKKTLKFVFGLIGFWFKLVMTFVVLLFKPALIAFDFCFDKFKNFYHDLLSYCLDNRGKTIVATIVLLVLTLLIGLNIEKRLMPEIDSGEFILEVELSPGSSLEATEKLLKKYEELIFVQKDYVKSVFSSGGIPDEKSKISGSTIYKGQLQVKLKNGYPTNKFVQNLRTRIEEYNASEPGHVKININTEVSTLSDFIKAENADIAVQVSGSNLDELEEVSLKVISKLEKMGNLSEIKSNFVSNKPKIELKFNKDYMRSKEIFPGEIESFLSTMIKGKKVSDFNDFDEKIDIIITRPDMENKNIAEIFKTLYVKNGVGIPLKELVTYEYNEGPESIERINQQRVITITMNIKEGAFDQVVKSIEAKMKEVVLYKGMKINVGGQNTEMKDSFKQMIFMFILSVLLVYMVLASQFESLLSPFIIIFAVPLSLIGVAIGLLITGETLNVMSIIGIIMLIGIVVNDAIVKVDFIDNEIKQGLSMREAIMLAGEKRLRPILMTTISTVFGMIPMALAFGGSSELRKPLAITVIFGLSFATMLTLIVIPVVYSLLKKEKAGK